MSSGFSSAVATLTAVVAGLVLMNQHVSSRTEHSGSLETHSLDHHHPRSALRVCADPNNLPFSNSRGEGFENALARMIAADLNRPLEYTWWPQRRGFIRNTLGAGKCDVVIGMPASSEMAVTTQPYYRSTYVFVTRQSDALRISSLDDERLKDVRIGLHMIGDDYSNVPPAQALARRGLIHNVRGYSIYGDYSKPDPPRDLIDALTRGEIDVAIAWGPLAGYFAKRSPVALELAAVSPSTDGPLRMTFAISMAVRREDKPLKQDLERLIATRAERIERILIDFGVPLLAPTPVTAHQPGD